MTVDFLKAAASNQDLVREYDRLRGTSLSAMSKRTPLEQMIDKATGKEDSELRGFVEFAADLYRRMEKAQ
jgi:hypothetical protein